MHSLQHVSCTFSVPHTNWWNDLWSTVFTSNSKSFYSVGVQNQSVDSPFIYVPAGAVLVEEDFYPWGPLVCPLSHPDYFALQGRAAFGQPRMLVPRSRIDIRDVKSLVRWLEIVYVDFTVQTCSNRQGLARSSWKEIRDGLPQSLDIVWKFSVKLVLVLSQIMLACWPLLSN